MLARVVEGAVFDGRVEKPRVFFFQAEDGIRDADVTGVQTCALPISEADVARKGEHNGFICNDAQLPSSDGADDAVEGPCQSTSTVATGDAASAAAGPRIPVAP